MTESEQEIHRRWIRNVNRVTGTAEYRNVWYWEQCMDCRHWRPLGGALGEDWGACANARSAFDGTVRFEHDGCDQFEHRPDG